MATKCDMTTLVETRLLERNAICRSFFDREAPLLAVACQEMAKRFLRGGRLLAFGRGPQATDAQHVSVEFVHPVIVGKRALPALDLSPLFQSWLPAVVRPDDMVMGFGPPGGDEEVDESLSLARRRGAMTFALPGTSGSYLAIIPSPDPFVHQEVVEILYHTLWESVHVFFEHRELGHEVGEAGFLYPFLGQAKQDTATIVKDVAESIRMKVVDDAELRARVAREESQQIGRVIAAVAERLQHGGKLILFGNGGSATDANDWAFDCVAPPPVYQAVPAISLALEAANLSAIANDVGVEVTFVRQLIAHAEKGDIAVGISTSGGSRNVVEPCAKRGNAVCSLWPCLGTMVVTSGATGWPISRSSCGPITSPASRKPKPRCTISSGRGCGR